MMQDDFSYQGRPIATISSLEKALGIPHDKMLEIINNPDAHYFPNALVVKSNGSTRQTYRLSKELSGVQIRICKEFLQKIAFPYFIAGGVKDKNIPRSPYYNAKLHSSSRFVVKEDIKAFFPSITCQRVFNVWHHLFKFSPEVSGILAQLTTLDGAVAEGSNTSSYLANICMFEREAAIAKNLLDRGFVYSRYIDDIHVSSHLNRVAKCDVGFVCDNIYALLTSYGFKPHRKYPKHVISNSPKERLVNNQRIHNGVIKKPKDYRRAVRQDVRFLIKLAGRGEHNTPKYAQLYTSIAGKINHLSQYHPDEANTYQDLLKKIPRP